MAAQRLDKIIASTGRWSRREVKDLVRQGRVTVDGVPARSAEEKADPEQAVIAVNGERVAYLRELGWEIDPEPLTTLQFLLPPKLSGDYITYNDLQKAQGFDLETCCGKQVTRYTYTVTNYPQRPDGVQLNLYICEDLPVAGDVVCTGTDGFQDTLVFPQQTDASC